MLTTVKNLNGKRK